MTDFLELMAASSAERAALVDPAAQSKAAKKPLSPLSSGGFGIIAEIKARSPAEGDLGGQGVDRRERARQYVNGGATAISVLTEPSRFSGNLRHLEEVADAVSGTPVMRKDFLVDPVQVHEARHAGASGVLLIAAMLDDTMLRRMLDAAWTYEMFVLLEAFDEQDLRRMTTLNEDADVQAAAERGLLLGGVNTRNLRTLEVDAERLATLAPLLPAIPCVAESGLKDPSDAAAAARLGYRLALVGTALMRSADPAALVAAMRAAGGEALAA